MEQSRSRTSTRLESWWRGLPVASKLPELISFDLLDIHELIPDLFVINLIDEPKRRAHIKLSGSNLNQRAGFELTGQNFLDLWDEDVSPVVWNVFSRSVQRPCGFVLTSRVRLKNTTSSVMEATVVPYQASDVSRPSIVMSCVWTGVALTDAMQNPLVIEIPEKFCWIDLGHGVPARSPIDP